MAGVFTVELESKHGAACNVSAAIAAACGAAADVQAKKQGVCPAVQGPVAVVLVPFMPNPPAPVTTTSSVAATSGFIRAAACGVASVGPWLL